MQANLTDVYPEYLTTGAVARHCGVSKVTVLRWIEKGILVAFKLPGGQNRIHRDDFYAFASRYNIPIRTKPGISAGNSNGDGTSPHAGHTGGNRPFY